jgi:hypothetical protein
MISVLVLGTCIWLLSVLVVTSFGFFAKTSGQTPLQQGLNRPLIAFSVEFCL